MPSSSPNIYAGPACQSEAWLPVVTSMGRCRRRVTRAKGSANRERVGPEWTFARADGVIFPV